MSTSRPPDHDGPTGRLHGAFHPEAADGCSLVVGCMDRNDYLVRSLESWLAVDGIDEVLVLDWSSEVPVAQTLGAARDPRIVVVRVEGEPWWHLARALNVAFRMARYRRILKIDSDVSLEPGFLDAHPLEEGSFFAGNWRLARDENESHLNGSFLCWREDLLAVGGFDERLSNYGWDDCDLYGRWGRAGLIRRDLDLDLLSHFPHGGRTARQPEVFRNLPVRDDALEAFLIDRNRVLCEGLSPWGGVESMTTYAIEPAAEAGEGYRLSAPARPEPDPAFAELLDEATLRCLRGILQARGLPEEAVSTAALEELLAAYALLYRVEPVEAGEADGVAVITWMRDDELPAQRAAHFRHLTQVLSHPRVDEVHVLQAESGRAGDAATLCEVVRRCPVTLTSSGGVPTLQRAIQYANATLAEGACAVILAPGAAVELGGMPTPGDLTPGDLRLGGGSGAGGPRWAVLLAPYLGLVPGEHDLGPWVDSCGAPSTEACPVAPEGGPPPPGSAAAWGCGTHGPPTHPEADGLGALRRELEDLEAEGLRLEAVLERGGDDSGGPDLVRDVLAASRLLGRATRRGLHRVRMKLGLEEGPRIPIKPLLRDGLVLLWRAVKHSVRPPRSEVKAAEATVRPLHRLPERARERRWLPRDRRLVLDLTGDLAARLALLEKGLEASRVLGCRLEVYWPVEEDCPWKIFEVIAGGEEMGISQGTRDAALRDADGSTGALSPREVLRGEAPVMVWRVGDEAWDGPEPTGRLASILQPGFGPAAWGREAPAPGEGQTRHRLFVLGDEAWAEELLGVLGELEGVERLPLQDGAELAALAPALRAEGTLVLLPGARDRVRLAVAQLLDEVPEDRVADRRIDMDDLHEMLRAVAEEERRIASVRAGLRALGACVLDVASEDLRAWPGAVLADVAGRLGQGLSGAVPQPELPPPLEDLVTNPDELRERFPYLCKESARVRAGLARGLRGEGQLRLDT